MSCSGRFSYLPTFPGIAGPPIKVKRRNVFRFPFGSHVIVFTTMPGGVRIARLFHARMDWRRRIGRERV
jgi:plasmid stabilization system protein ParE